MINRYFGDLLLSIVTFFIWKWYQWFAILEVSFWAHTTVVKLLRTYLTLILILMSCFCDCEQSAGWVFTCTWLIVQLLSTCSVKMRYLQRLKSWGHQQLLGLISKKVKGPALRFRCLCIASQSFTARRYRHRRRVTAICLASCQQTETNNRRMRHVLVSYRRDHEFSSSSDVTSRPVISYHLIHHCCYVRQSFVCNHLQYLSV